MPHGRSKMLDALFITLTIVSFEPAFSNSEQRAADHLRRALMETETAKGITKNAEQFAEDKVLPFVGMDKEDLVYFAWAIPIANQRISTKPFKNFKLSGDDWTLRPEIEYKFSGDDQLDSKVVFIYTWK